MDNNNKIKKYITLRTKEVALILASKEDMLEVAPEGDKKSLLIAIEHGRAKIDELKKIQKDLNKFE